jgi:dienelactone hydrolase
MGVEGLSWRQWRRWANGAALVVLATGVIGCGPSRTTSPAEPPEPSRAAVIPLPTRLPDVLSFEQALPLFEYDRTIPFSVTRLATYTRGNASLVDLTYLGANSIQMPAYLVLPAGQGPFAAVVWMGWTGGYDQLRSEFLEEAMALAERGVVSLLVSGYFPWYVTPADKDADRMGMIGQVRDLRRAIDFVASQPGVDATRIAFVGHSMGAMHGLNLAAVDSRVRAAVLMSPHSTLADWVFGGYGLSSNTEVEYRRAMACFDPLAFAPYAGRTSLFFQFGNDDDFVPRDVALSLYSAASQPKTVAWYEGGHDLDESARVARDRWLDSQLHFDS